MPISLSAYAKTALDYLAKDFAATAGHAKAAYDYVGGNYFIPVTMVGLGIIAMCADGCQTNSDKGGITTGSSAPNKVPTLSAPAEPGFERDCMSPDDGDGNTAVRYKVIYTDQDNEPPIDPKVTISGTDYSLIQDTGATDPKLRNSRYDDGEQLTTSDIFLPKGVYTHTFHTSDGKAEAHLVYNLGFTSLSPSGKIALDKRFSYALYLTAAGTRTSAVNAKGESDELLKLLAVSNDPDADAFIDAHWAAEEAANWDILCGGTPVTKQQHAAYVKSLYTVWTNGTTADQTANPVPYPVNGPIADDEIDNKKAGGGWGIAIVDNKIRYYLKRPDGSEVAWPTYTFTQAQMDAIKALVRKSLARTYSENEDLGRTYSDDGEQVRQSDFDE